MLTSIIYRVTQGSRVLAGCIAGMVIAGCGGGAQLTCGIVGCTPSSTLQTSEMAPNFTVSTQGESVSVTAGYRSGGGVTNDVQLDSDKLTVITDDGTRIAMSGSDSNTAWSLNLQGNGAGRRYSIELMRKDGTALVSTITLPPAFVLNFPLGQVNMVRTGTPVQISVSTSATETLSSRARGSCGTLQYFYNDFRFAPPNVLGSGSAYMLDPANVIAYLSGVPASSTQCNLDVSLSRVAKGVISPAYRSDGTFVGRFEKTVALIFDAR